MFDSIIAKIILGWIRHMVGMAGAVMVSHGYLSADQGQQFAGAVMVIVPLLFSAWDKFQAQQAKNAAILAVHQS